MIELPLIFLGGLLGSAHCVGMCGGFALMVGAGAQGLGHNLGRQVIYSVGRIFSYSVCGATLGYAGLQLVEDLPTVVNVQAILAILAGVLLVTQGLLSAGVIPRGALSRFTAIVTGNRTQAKTGCATHSVGGCLATGMLRSFLRAHELRHVFLAGMLTGFLPCGLVYAYLALATSASDFIGGAATMIAFGLGTVPLMVLAGSGASLVSLATRQGLLRAAAWCVVVTGFVSLARGFGFLSVAGWHAAQSCPMCQ